MKTEQGKLNKFLELDHCRASDMAGAGSENEAFWELGDITHTLVSFRVYTVCQFVSLGWVLLYD